MKNLTAHALILWIILLVVTAALTAVIPFAHTTVFWLAAACDLVMFVAVECVFVRSFRRGGTLESKLLGWPIFKAGFAALLVQIVVGFVLMALAGVCPVWAAALAELLVFAIALAALTVRDAARETVAASEQALRDETAAWKAIRQRASAIAAETGHPDIKRLAEDIRYADPKPTAMDAQLAEMLETLSSYADAANIRKAQDLLRQRNDLAKMSK